MNLYLRFEIAGHEPSTFCNELQGLLQDCILLGSTAIASRLAG
jgi:hypothetical protein